MSDNIITKDLLVKELKDLGVMSGDLINVKCSLKSIGQVDGGANTLIEALLDVVGEKGTIITDSFINIYRKSVAKKKPLSDRYTPSYAGALANAMIKYRGAYRSNHPVQKFVAIGYKAKELMESHTPESYAYDVLRKMCQMNGKNLKIGSDKKVVGVGTTHVAVGELGFRQKSQVLGVYYLNDNNEKVFFERNWAGVCSRGLIKFIPYYERGGAVISKGMIGNAEAKITDMKKTLEIELGILKDNPTFFMCNEDECVDCKISWEFSKGNKLKLLFHYLFPFKARPFVYTLRYIIYKQKFYPEK